MKPKRTILCVDDNEQSLSIRKVLLETRGYRVISCLNGEDALSRFKRGGVDLVLTDLIMPGLDGAKLIEAIKAISPRTPAILLSGKVRVKHSLRGLRRAGFDLTGWLHMTRSSGYGPCPQQPEDMLGLCPEKE